MANERTYGNAEIIAATIFGASITATAVGLEALLASNNLVPASDPVTWLIPGVLGVGLSMLYARGYSSLPGVKA